MSLVKLESEFRQSLELQATSLQSLASKIRKKGPIPQHNTDITDAILLRLRAYYLAQGTIKQFLNKRYLTAASDFFVEAVLFYLKLYCEFHSRQLEVHSERQLTKTKNSIRPDISVWNANDVIAIVECKTQLGWGRDKWDADFKAREATLRSDFPKAKAFLLVMTSRNWHGFPARDPRIGKTLFTLSSEWPPNIDPKHVDRAVVNPIEPLFKRIVNGRNVA